jgi:hypothetical protein
LIDLYRTQSVPSKICNSMQAKLMAGLITREYITTYCYLSISQKITCSSKMMLI